MGKCLFGNKRVQKGLGLLRAGILLCTLFCRAATAETLPVVEPREIGMDAAVLARIDRIVERSITAKNMPGCVVCIGRHGKIAFLKAYGNKRVSPQTLPATIDTVYDLASLTKPVATTTCVMILVEQGKLELDAAVARYLPEFQTPEKEAITVRQLLLHTAGFIPDNHLKDYMDGPEKAVQRLLALKPITKPGEKFAYSDVSFQLLGILVERVSGQSLDAFAEEHVFSPLGMNETAFRPKKELAARAAPTFERELGQVHDPRAFRTDGVAGHAGLFSTANDLAVFAAMLLGEGQGPGGSRILKPESVRLMATAMATTGGYRGLGWDMQSVYSGNRGKTMSPRAFGHGGFTGTALWIDPGFDLFVVFLSNRVHPNGKGNVNPLAGEIGTIAVDSVIDFPDDAVETIASARQNIAAMSTKCQTETKTAVLPGVDVLRQNDFSILKNKRVGLITNHTGLDRRGKAVPILLREAPDVKLTALFSPEHGFTGTFDQENVPDGRDPTTGLTVYSLYGKHRKPTPEMLANVDILVFDIQDIGTRFYTYIATMLGGMEAATMRGIPFVVLDRPNPIGGKAVEGPMLESGRECTVGCYRIPVRHGMTVGELALMMSVQRRLELDLHIVPCLGWSRKMDFDDTGLTWVNPSPNMRSLTAAFLYPGVGLLEFTNLSVGRGTAAPFEVLGAPWIDENVFVDMLRKNAESAKLDGLSFEPTRFTPDASKFKDEPCGGVRFVLNDSQKLNSVRLGMVLATTLRSLYRDKWETDRLDTLLLDRKINDMIIDCRSVTEIEAAWKNELGEFMKIRDQFLLYD